MSAVHPTTAAIGQRSGGRGGLLVVTSHPDDETLIAGGTLAACAAAGVPTGVICLTRGEDGPIADPELADRAGLPAVREAELDAACAELGVSFVRCLSFPDGQLEWTDRRAVVAELVSALDSFRPAAVVTFGEDGLYWHPDHIATLAYVRRALARARRSPLLYRASLPPTLMAKLVAELRRRHHPTDLWGIPAEDFGYRVGKPTAVDVRAFVACKLSALRCHRTQLGPAHALAEIPADLAERYLGTEWFVAKGDSGWLKQAVGRAADRAESG